MAIARYIGASAGIAYRTFNAIPECIDKTVKVNPVTVAQKTNTPNGASDGGVDDARFSDRCPAGWLRIDPKTRTRDTPTNIDANENAAQQASDSFAANPNK